MLTNNANKQAFTIFDGKYQEVGKKLVHEGEKTITKIIPQYFSDNVPLGTNIFKAFENPQLEISSSK